MENYEKAYKEALKVIESLYNVVKYQSSSDALLTSQTIEKAFPELRESEDERIRKGLIKGLSAMRDIHKHQTFSDDAINIDDAIAWLEKQGEQKPADKVELKWKKGNDGEFLYENSVVWIHNETKTLATAGLLMDSNTFYIPISELEKLPKEQFEKQGEQKHSWSEEDKKQIQQIERIVKDSGASANLQNKISDWLKSLKPHWKPSEEQMEIIDMILTNESMDDNVARILRELKEQLEKL